VVGFSDPCRRLSDPSRLDPPRAALAGDLYLFRSMGIETEGYASKSSSSLTATAFSSS
jgi:hypothetical protein